MIIILHIGHVLHRVRTVSKGVQDILLHMIQNWSEVGSHKIFVVAKLAPICFATVEHGLTYSEPPETKDGLYYTEPPETKDGSGFMHGAY